MASQFMAFLFEPSVRGVSLRCDLNGDGTLALIDAAIALAFASGSRPCDPATLGRTLMSAATTASPSSTLR
jgi:hypothetical protein